MRDTFKWLSKSVKMTQENNSANKKELNKYSNLTRKKKKTLNYHLKKKPQSRKDEN